MPRTPWKIAGFVAGIAAFLAIVLADSGLHHFESFGRRPAFAAAVTSLMAIWWLTEALPIYVTACVPLVLFPVFQPWPGGFLKNVSGAAQPYVNPYIFLFMGGMCIAAAMQQCGLHRRIALSIMRAIGTDPKRLLLGFLCATAFISLWISNTATATMMVPIALAVIAQFERREGRRLGLYGAAIMMSIAYAANIGGIGTKIGTAPNSQFCGFMAQPPRNIEVTFLKFLAVGLPFVAMMIPAAWASLWVLGRRDAPKAEGGAAAVREELAALGPMKRSEWAVLVLFLVTAVLWISGQPVTEALQKSWKAVKSAHVEGAIAMAAAALLLLLRIDRRQTLELRTLKTVPWETLVLLGGSFSMAEAVQASGCSKWLGTQVGFVGGLGPFQQVLTASVATVALSAFASNTATVAVMLPVLHGLVGPAAMPTVLFAATIASSCDFALPAGTPPNAIVFASGYVKVPTMAKTGVVLDLAAACLAAAWCWMIVRYVLPVTVGP